MDEVVKNLVGRISSYNIFNNLFPGLICCFVVEKSTRFELSTGHVWENLFFYYFVGIIISRLGSIVIEKKLRDKKVKNKKTNETEKFIKLAPYDNYIEASENCDFIKALNETNNMYRTIIAMLWIVIGAKLYDWLFYGLVNKLGVVGKNVLFIMVCFILVKLFVYSYKKQTEYITKRVNNYTKLKEKE